MIIDWSQFESIDESACEILGARSRAVCREVNQVSDDSSAEQREHLHGVLGRWSPHLE
jgi:hypothetical protein